MPYDVDMNGCRKFVDYETAALQKAKDSGGKIQLIFSNGDRVEAAIEDFNCEVIVARVRGGRWIVYKYNILAIVTE